jgi:hypothetical protein
LKEQLSHLNEEELRNLQKEKKFKKSLQIKNHVQATENDTTPKLIFDISFGDLMNQHEMKSLAA